MSRPTADVRVLDVAARPTAVVPATTSWPELPALWPVLLGEVWTCLRAEGITSGCPNVMLYLDDTPRVEVGAELTRPCPLTGRVVGSTLPSGRVARAVHQGPYAALADTHDTVLVWCEARGLRVAGPRWEVYGPHRDDPARLTTEVSWLLATG